MSFLVPPVGEEGAPRERPLPPTAGEDPLVVVAGPVLTFLRVALPGAGSPAPADGPHPGGTTYPLSLLSLLLGRMGVLPGDGDLASAPLVTWVDEPKSLLRLLRQAISDGLKIGKPTTITESCQVIDTFMAGVEDYTGYHLTLADTHQAETRTPPAEGAVDNVVFEVTSRDYYRLGEPRGRAESVAFFLGPRYRRGAWEGGYFASSFMIVTDSFRAYRPEVKSHPDRWVLRRALRWLAYATFPEHALRPELGLERDHEALLTLVGIARGDQSVMEHSFREAIPFYLRQRGEFPLTRGVLSDGSSFPRAAEELGRLQAALAGDAKAPLSGGSLRQVEDALGESGLDLAKALEEQEGLRDAPPRAKVAFIVAEARRLGMASGRAGLGSGEGSAKERGAGVGKAVTELLTAPEFRKVIATLDGLMALPDTSAKDMIQAALEARQLEVLRHMLGRKRIPEVHTTLARAEQFALPSFSASGTRSLSDALLSVVLPFREDEDGKLVPPKVASDHAISGKFLVKLFAGEEWESLDFVLEFIDRPNFAMYRKPIPSETARCYADERTISRLLDIWPKFFRQMGVEQDGEKRGIGWALKLCQTSLKRIQELPSEAQRTMESDVHAFMTATLKAMGSRWASWWTSKAVNLSAPTSPLLSDFSAHVALDDRLDFAITHARMMDTLKGGGNGNPRLLSPPSPSGCSVPGLHVTLKAPPLSWAI